MSILVVRLAHPAHLRTRLRHVSSAPSAAYSWCSIENHALLSSHTIEKWLWCVWKAVLKSHIDHCVISCWIYPSMSLPMEENCLESPSPTVTYIWELLLNELCLLSLKSKEEIWRVWRIRTRPDWAFSVCCKAYGHWLSKLIILIITLWSFCCAMIALCEWNFELWHKTVSFSA